ncbi:MAG: DUF3972 domain-containing protein [Phycisphaerales bacterium]|nr:DUF3972 domain-containing protein [Phycisphaerales bacterium]
MNRYGAIAWMAMTLLVAGSFGCVGLDKHQALERAHRTLQEQNARLAQDLADREMEIQQKNTIIDGLQKQLAAKDETIASLTAENANLRNALAKAQELMESMGRQIGDVKIITQALPERLHRALEDFVAKHPDLLEYDAAQGAVRWKADLLFPLGSNQLATSGEVLEALKQFAAIVNSADAAGFDVIIVGHTCTTPIRRPETLAEHKTNWHLSTHRSIAVMNMLASEQVSEKRMGVMGYGEWRPISSDKGKNRRVEIFLVQSGTVQDMGS